MTAIVLYKGALYADRQRMATGVNSTTVSSEGPKIFISDDGQFAWGRSGDLIPPHRKEEVEASLRILITKYKLGTCNIDFKDVPSKLLQEGGTPLFVLTRTDGLVFNPLEIMKDFLGYDTACDATGTGGKLVLSGLLLNKTPKTAFVLANRFDAHTGRTFDVIKQRQLKEFIIY